MKILVCDNSGMVSNDGKLSCHEKTGDFGAQLVKCGHKVTYYQFSKPSVHTINDFDLRAHGIDCVDITYGKSKLLSYWKAFINSFKVVYEADFIYQFAPSSIIFVSVIAFLMHKPYGFYVRGMKKLDSRLYRFLFKHSKVVLTVSDVFTNSIKAYAYNRSCVETIKPMVDISESDIFYRDNYKKPDIFNLTFLARLDRDKGLQELVEAVEFLKQSTNIKVVLNIFGDGAYYNTLQSFIEEHNLTEVIKIKGSVRGKDAVIDVLRKADAYILPTYHEGFPRTLYEAMVSGTPIITTLVGGIPGLMKDNYNCLAIEAKSSKSIVKQICYLIDNYESIAPKITANSYKEVARVVDSKRPSHSLQLNSILKTRVHG